MLRAWSINLTEVVLCDTHIHLLAPDWWMPPAQHIAAATAAGIHFLLQPGVRVADWDQLLTLAQQHTQVYAAPGLHPLYAEQWNVSVANRLREAAQQPKVVAIGEIGLDGSATVPISVQEIALRGQLELAVELNLPVLLHGRQATGALLKILRELEVGQQIGGIWHGFSGSLEVARELVDLGFLLGIGPILLRPNARKLPAVVTQIPAQAMVLETDAPDMADEPEVLIKVAAKLAQIKGWTLPQTADITTENAMNLFKKAVLTS